jgi:glutathione S-transferase
MSFIVETTAGCRRTPILLFALEEAGASYRLHLHAPGRVLERHDTVGPVLYDDTLVIPELAAALRHVARHADALWPRSREGRARADTFLEMATVWLFPAVGRYVRAHRRGETDDEAVAVLERCLRRLERAVRSSPYLIGDLTVADCPFVWLAERGPFTPLLDTLPALREYAGRLSARPAWERARSRGEAYSSAPLLPSAS